MLGTPGSGLISVKLERAISAETLDELMISLLNSYPSLTDFATY